MNSGERITDERLAELRGMAGPLSDPRWTDTLSALRELSERRERERWIPVAERLPKDKYRKVLVRSQTGTPDVLLAVMIERLFKDAQANGEECWVKEWREVPE